MSVAASPIPVQTDLPPLPVYRFSVEQFQRLRESGILGADEPVRFEDGLLILETPGPRDPRVKVITYPGPENEGVEPLALRRFSVAEYYRMIDARVLIEGAPLELLKGWIVRKMTINPPHAVAVGLAFAALYRRVPAGWHCRSQGTVSTDESQPEPDFSIVRGAIRDYGRRHPEPADTALAGEVADSSLRIDRRTKYELYASNGIPVYWIVNLVDRQVEVYTEPSGPSANTEYRQRQDYGPDDSVPLVVDGQEAARVEVRDLLP